MDFHLAFELTKSYSEQVKSTNNRWTFAAALSLLALFFDPKLPDQSPFGFNIPEKSFGIALFLALSVANIAYTVAHHVTTHSSVLLRRLVDKVEAPIGSGIDNKTAQELIWIGYTDSSFDRVKPVFEGIANRRLREMSYGLFKTILDVFFVGIPAAGVILAFSQFEREVGPIASGPLWSLIIVVLWIVLLVSLGLSISLLIRILDYIWK